MATINTYGNKQTPVIADILHLWSEADAADMNITLEQLRDLMIGILGNLATDDKASIVAAINELNGPVKYAASLPKPHNGLYDGRNLKNVFASAADFAAAVFAFVSIRERMPLPFGPVWMYGPNSLARISLTRPSAGLFKV